MKEKYLKLMYMINKSMLINYFSRGSNYVYKKYI